jgi:site-specific recombinase XerD
MNEQIVKPMLSAVQTQRTPSKMRNAAVISIFYSTGLRLNEIADLKIENIDFGTGAMGSPDRNEK